MKILWVKAGGLVPLDTGGKMRSYYLSTELARRHAITLFTFYPAHAGDVHAELRRHFARVVCWPIRSTAPRLADSVRYLLSLLSFCPYSAAKHCRPEVAKALRRTLQAETYEVLICDPLIAAPVIPWELPYPRILFTHNVEALIWERLYHAAPNPLRKAVCWRERRVVARFERRYLERADHVAAVSETERNLFAQFIDPRRISVIPNGVDVNYFRPEAGYEQPNTLLFTGSMDWVPNEDGILYFIKEILPRIRERLPHVKLDVVGRRPSDRLRSLAARNGGVQVTGWVEDVRPHMRAASVYVVSLRTGGGTRLKILEAMAMGKAVVSTSVGAEGLLVQHGENIILADEPEEFAARVTELLGDPVARHRLGHTARQLVEQNYSWSSISADFDGLLSRAVDEWRGDHPRLVAAAGQVNRVV